MLNKENSQFLHNLNPQQIQNQINLDNQIKGIVSRIFLNNNFFLKYLQNRADNMKNNTTYFNVNRNLPNFQYQKNNLIQEELGESNLLDLLRNISLEPSNLNLNNNNLFEQPLS